MQLALFDLDGTLCTGHIPQGIRLHHHSQKVNRFYFYVYMGLHLPLFPLWKAGIIPQLSMRRISAANLGWTFRGMSPREVQQASQWIAANFVGPRVRHNVVNIMRSHQNRGDLVILVSGTPEPLLREIGAFLGVKDVIGTPLRMKEGRYSGASEAPVCMGEGKITRVQGYLDGQKVDRLASYAYADSASDLPVLEWVGHPTAVYPDDVLMKVALTKGWKIIGEVED